MRKLCQKAVLFAVLFLCVDFAIGRLGTYLRSHARYGQSQKDTYICDRMTEDVLIMGSSRASHHYDPTILEDSLGLTCYNCAYDGCGSITALGLLNILTQRYAPKVLIYDVYPHFDYQEYDAIDNKRFLGTLKMFYDRKGIEELFMKVDTIERYKMWCQMYRMNSKLLELVKDNTTPLGEYVKGYIPKDEQMRHTLKIGEDEILPHDALKEQCLRDIVALCQEKGIQLIFTASPAYQRTTSRQFAFVEELARENGLPFINHFCDTAFVFRKDYFFDSVHMNRKGATAYTRLFAAESRGYISH